MQLGPGPRLITKAKATCTQRTAPQRRTDAGVVGAAYLVLHGDVSDSQRHDIMDNAPRGKYFWGWCSCMRSPL